MKRFVLLLAFAAGCFAHASPASDVVRSYALNVYDQYSAAIVAAEKLAAAVETFVANPTEENLVQARQAWLDARTAYSPTEVFRFYNGPIDDDDGPEGRLNAWPLDEAYIDYVESDPNAGFIQNPDRLPEFSPQALDEMNEKDGEENIATGYHALEFMLWGQDLSDDGPGNRPVSDFIPGQHPFAERRGQYSVAVAQLIVSDLREVAEQWNPSTGAYAAQFVDPANEETSLRNIFFGVTELAGFELSQERMYTPLQNPGVEEEHSCFSDNTHNDVLDNFRGIKMVLENGLIDLVATKDTRAAAEIRENLTRTESAIAAMPTPFDQAIVHSPKAVMRVIQTLEDLAESVKYGASRLGVKLDN